MRTWSIFRWYFIDFCFTWRSWKIPMNRVQIKTVNHQLQIKLWILFSQKLTNKEKTNVNAKTTFRYKRWKYKCRDYWRINFEQSFVSAVKIHSKKHFEEWLSRDGRFNINQQFTLSPKEEKRYLFMSKQVVECIEADVFLFLKIFFFFSCLWFPSEKWHIHSEIYFHVISLSWRWNENISSSKNIHFQKYQNNKAIFLHYFRNYFTLLINIILYMHSHSEIQMKD
jgi:hypothetical protein